MIKEDYQNVNIEVIEFDGTDVIVTSNGEGGPVVPG